MFHDRLKRSDHKIELTQGCNGRARQTSPGLLDINAAADGPLSEEEAKQHRLRALELHRRREQEIADREQRIEEALWFNLRSAFVDLDLVCRLDSWGAEDFVAVSLGKNPRVVAWTLVQPHTTQSPFAQEFARRRELVQSAVAAGLFKDPVVPTIALAWAKLKDICLPEGLEEGVLRYAACGGGDSTMLEFERLNTALAERDSEIASLREQLATAETRLRNALPHTKKIETMKVVVAAMAVIGYGHDPFAKKSPSTTEIVSDLEKLGVDRDADTVRAVLRAALKTIPQEHLVQHFGRSKTNSG